MPTPSASSLEIFLNDYENYKNSCQFADDCAQNIISLATKMQLDPNFTTALEQAEQDEVVANLLAAQQVRIVPVERVPPIIPSETNNQ